MSRRIKIALIAIVFGLELAYIGAIAAAPHFDAARTVSLRMTAIGMKVALFPGHLVRKNAACSIGDVWREGASADSALLSDRLAAQTRVLARDGDLDQVETPLGKIWIPRGDFGALVHMLEDEAADIYRVDRVSAGSIVLDCGANVGIFTRQALRRGAKLVVAIEPASEPLRSLRRTFAAEIAAGRVIIFPKGVWDREQQFLLTHDEHHATTDQSVAIDRGQRGETIQLTTIDRLVEELKLDRVDFIKMDIEGAEPNALRGAAGVLTRFRPRMSIALEHRPTDPEQIPPIVASVYPGATLAHSRCTNLGGTIMPGVLFVD